MAAKLDAQPDPQPGQRPQQPDRDDDGFSLIELVVVMAIIGALSLIGFVAYTAIIGDARGTALDANIQTAAEALYLEASLQPTLLGDATGGRLTEAMTEHTNFVWEADVAANANWHTDDTDTSDIVKFQILGTDDVADPGVAPTFTGSGGAFTAGAAPMVPWLPGGDSAVRLIIRNPAGEWRCAVVILAARAAGTFDATDAREAQGIWYDGGGDLAESTISGATPTIGAGAQSDLHACSPLAATGTLVTRPASSITWTVDGATTPDRTLHRSTSALD